MAVPPWVVWVVMLTVINLLVFIAIRGRWGKSAVVLGIAALIGVVVGDQVAARTGLEVMRIGDMHVVAASVGAQLLMLAVSVLTALGPIRIEETPPPPRT